MLAPRRRPLRIRPHALTQLGWVALNNTGRATGILIPSRSKRSLIARVRSNSVQLLYVAALSWARRAAFIVLREGCEGSLATQVAQGRDDFGHDALVTAVPCSRGSVAMESVIPLPRVRSS